MVRPLTIAPFSSAICFLICYSFLSSLTHSNRTFCGAAGLLTGSMGIFLLTGPLLLRAPGDSNIFLIGLRYAIYYIVILVFEICWGYCLLLINGQRVEEALRATEKKLRSTNHQLEKEIRERITLSGLLPICWHCKKIRDDKRYWNHLESYIETHSEADFSHSICPECADELYPELDLDEENTD